MTGAGAETKVVNSGRVPGEIERLGHLFELSGFAEHHFPHVNVWCETFANMILLIFFSIFRRSISLMYLKVECNSITRGSNKSTTG